ncbi:hypothetical protein QM565_21450 [Geitlerinema splendidum]|jgi:hypothetical protein|nr:hypothetical protein [Geitlerinema splendidum]
MNKLLLGAALLTVLNINIVEARGTKTHSAHPSKGIPVNKVDSTKVVKNHPEAAVGKCNPSLGNC